MTVLQFNLLTKRLLFFIISFSFLSVSLNETDRKQKRIDARAITEQNFVVSILYFFFVSLNDVMKKGSITIAVFF